MLNVSDAPLNLETIVSACRQRVCDSSDRKACLKALAAFDELLAVRERARSIRSAIQADDQLKAMNVELHAELRRRALEEFHPPHVAELQGKLWEIATGRLEGEVGPVLARANRRMAEKLERAADDLRESQRKVLEQFGLQPSVTDAERELRCGAGWFRAASARPLNLSSQSDPRRSLSEGFAEAL